VKLLPLRTVALITGCSDPEARAGGDQLGGAAQSAAHTVLHVHGVTREPSDGKIYLARYTGLYRCGGSMATPVSPIST
jgi:hypothetical protein